RMKRADRCNGESPSVATQWRRAHARGCAPPAPPLGRFQGSRWHRPLAGPDKSRSRTHPDCQRLAAPGLDSKIVRDRNSAIPAAHVECSPKGFPKCLRLPWDAKFFGIAGANGDGLAIVPVLEIASPPDKGADYRSLVNEHDSAEGLGVAAANAGSSRAKNLRCQQR